MECVMLKNTLWTVKVATVILSCLLSIACNDESKLDESQPAKERQQSIAKVEPVKPPSYDKNTVLNLIDSNLELTCDLFYNFTLFVHNLAYSETTSQEFIELLFLKIKGNA